MVMPCLSELLCARCDDLVSVPSGFVEHLGGQTLVPAPPAASSLVLTPSNVVVVTAER